MSFRVWRRGGFTPSAATDEIAIAAKFLRGSGAFDSEVFSILELAANPLPKKFQHVRSERKENLFTAVRKVVVVP